MPKPGRDEEIKSLRKDVDKLKQDVNKLSQQVSDLQSPDKNLVAAINRLHDDLVDIAKAIREGGGGGDDAAVQRVIDKVTAQLIANKQKLDAAVAGNEPPKS